MSNSINIGNLSGISKEIALACNSNSDKVLQGNELSIFTKVDGFVKELVSGAESINLSKIFQFFVKDLGSLLGKGLSELKRFACKILRIVEKFFNEKCHNGGRTEIVSAAKGYVGKINTDKQGNVVFSNGQSQPWCADTVSTILKDVAGEYLPKDFGSSAVSGLIAWGKKHDCYTQTSNMTNVNRANWIKKHVKPGDIMVQKRNGASHVGIVTKVNADGSFETIEGNASNKVCKRTYKPSSNILSGFISLDKFLPDDKNLFTDTFSQLKIDLEPLDKELHPVASKEDVSGSGL